MSGPNLISLLSAVVLISACVLATPQSEISNSIRFSKLLAEKSDLLKFTSISNTPPEARFHNVYTKAEEVQPSRSTSNQRFVDFPEARVITQVGPGEEFVRIGQSQVVSEEPAEDESDGILTRINQKPISGRTQVTALRQTSGKRLNISPVFPGKDEASIRRQSVDVEVEQHDESQHEESQHETEDPTASPDFEDTADEEEEVTTVQNTELARETDPPVTTPPTTSTTFTRQESSVSVVTQAPRVTIFDNRTTEVSSSTIPTTTAGKDDLENENLVLDTFHRKGHFPDFEDLPTHLATAESNQPARVNVRPASSGKDYEYEYIYYYYDDDDDDNSTTAKPILEGALQVPKADLTGVKPNGLDSEKFSGSKFAADPSNSLDAQRGQKSYPLVPITSVPQPLGNKPIVIKQSGMTQSPESEYSFPQVPRSGSVPITVVPTTTTPAPTTTRAPTRAPVVVTVPVQQERFPSRVPAPVLINEQPHNRFSPPIKQFQEEEPPRITQTRFPARQQSQEQFSRTRAPVPVSSPEPVLEPVVAPKTRFPARPQQQEQFSRPRVPTPVEEQEVVEEPVLPPTRFSAPRPLNSFSSQRVPVPPPTQAPVNPTPHFRNKAHSQQAPINDFAPPIIQIQLISTEAPVAPVEPRKPVYKEVPSGRRINSPRRPQQEEPELQQQAPQVASTTVAPPPVTEATPAAPAQRNPSQRNRFPSRGPPNPVHHDQFRTPLVPSRGSEPIVEIPAPELSTVSPTAEAEEKVKDNFARQKSINDLYALTRLHQLAINTRVPNRKNVDQPGQSYKGIPPKNSGGFINSAEVTTHFPEDNMLQSESTTISSFIPSSIVSSGDFQRLATTTTEDVSVASSSTTEESERPGLRTRNNRFRGRNRGTSSTTSTTEAAPRQVNPNRFAGRRRPFTSATPVPTAASETGDESVPSADPHVPRLREPTRNRFAGRSRPTTTSTTTEAGEPIHQDQEVVAQPQPTQQAQPQFPRRRPGFPPQQQQEPEASDAPPQPTQSQFPRRRPAQVPQPDPTEGEVSAAQPQSTPGLPRRRPGAFQGRRRPSTPAPSQVPAEAQPSPLEPSEVPIVPSNPSVPSETNERRANFGKRGRARPNAPTNSPSAAPAVEQPVVANRRPIIGRPLKSRVSTTTTELSEPIPAPTAIVIQTETDNEVPTFASPSVEPSPSAPVVPENVRAEAPEGGVVAQKVTVSSSTTTSESVEPPKRGSAGVLGRIRSRARPLTVQSTTVAPAVTVPERKPSRLNGILNRRKAGPAGPTLTTTENPVKPEEAHSKGQQQQQQQHEDASAPKPKEIIVQVSSVVTESEETSDHHGEAVDEHSSTTQGSILNRLKAQRKPGSLFRKRVES